MIRTIAPQQGHMAAGARSCVLAGADAWNAPVGMTVEFGSSRTRKDITTKRPARHLGGLPT